MGEPFQESNQHTRRIDEDLAHHGVVDEEIADAERWDEPGHDGIVSESEADQDRTDMRSEIGGYTSLVAFPATGRSLAEAAQSAAAPDRVVERLRRLDPDAEYASAAEMWTALGLSPGTRS